MRRVGLVLNVPKSQLAPTQTLDTHRRRVLARCRTNFPADGQGSQYRKRSVSTSIHASDDGVLWLSLLGRMSAATDAIPLGRLHIRPLLLYFLAHWSPPSNDMAALIPVKHNLPDHHLHWWLNRKYTRAGMLLDIPEAQTQLFTDASESGWGAHSDIFQVRGEWSAREAIRHINQLEMLAVLNALAAFMTQLSAVAEWLDAWDT